jgi:hypothetical protein
MFGLDRRTLLRCQLVRHIAQWKVTSQLPHLHVEFPLFNTGSASLPVL